MYLNYWLVFILPDQEFCRSFSGLERVFHLNTIGRCWSVPFLNRIP